MNKKCICKKYKKIEIIKGGFFMAKKRKMDAGKVFTRVMAGILAALMVLSVAGTLVYYIIML